MTTSLRRYAVRHSAVYLVSHAPILGRITKTELAAKYAGTLLGPLWAILAPLLLLSLYAVTYTLILKVRVGTMGQAEYVLFMFAGLVPFIATSEALHQGVSSVVANRALLSNTVFPIDLAPVKSVLLAQLPFAVGLVLIMVGNLAFRGDVPWTTALVPFIWILQSLALVGLVWFLALFNVVFRDLQMLMTALLAALLIVSPIAYTRDMVPPGLTLLVDLNPFAHFVMAYQQILVLEQVPSVGQWAILVGVSGAAFAAGGWFFAAMKRAMLDHV